MGRRFIGIVLAALFLAGSAAAEPVTIRTSWLAVPASVAPLLAGHPEVTVHLGHSYVLEPIHFTGTAPMITGLATGEVDVAPLSYSAFSLAIANGAIGDLKIIADQAQDGVPGYHTNEYYVLKDGPVRTIEDLKGRVLATNAIGGAVDMALRAMLRKHGLEDKRDYTIIEVNLPQQRAMLADGKVDLVAMIPPFSFDPEYARIARILFTQKEAMGKSQVIIWTTRQSFIDKNQAALTDYMEDTLRLIRWFTAPAHHAEAVKAVADFMKGPPERYDWVFTNRDGYRDPDGMPDMAALQANVDLQRDLGFIKAAIVVKNYAELGLVEEAARRIK